MVDRVAATGCSDGSDDPVGDGLITGVRCAALDVTDQARLLGTVSAVPGRAAVRHPAVG